MKLPGALLNSLVNIRGFEKEAFERIHSSKEQVTSIRINPLKLPMVNGQWSMVNGQSARFTIHHSPFTTHHSPLTIDAPVPWSHYGYYLVQRPSFTFDPLFHAGCYYVQEASSMFLEQALKQTVDLSQPLKILDLSAAPGGKSTHIQSLMSKDSLLVSNEVIRSRSNILRDNIIKWGSDNVMVTNNDPKDFAKLESYFDVIVVDAPCSGSGLFRRDEEAIGEWTENNVQLCSQRQQRILADVWPALKKNGVLIYSTCSYSKEEDEDIVDWMNQQLINNNEELIINEEWNITKSNAGYRFWPDKLKGEGFFIACVRRKDGEDGTRIRIKGKMELLNKKALDIVKKWVKQTDHELVKINTTVYAVPKHLTDHIMYLKGHLHTLYFGTMIGECLKEKLIPSHALAMSLLIAGSVERVELSYEQAVSYLKKKDLTGINAEKGWKLVTYESFPLGWANILPGRINNYYPKELRILKDI